MVTLALFGVGNWGRNYLNEAEKIPGLQIKYVLATTSLSLKSLPDQYIKLTDYRQILKDKSLDGVIIATPASTHFKLAREFINRGVNILIEKPLAMSTKEAKELLYLSSQKGSIVLVGHLHLYNPAFLKVIEKLKKIGKIQFLNYQAHSSPIKGDCPIIWDWGPHFISMFLEITKKLPFETHSKKTYDRVNIIFKFPGGPVATADIDCRTSEKKRILTVLGNKGLILFNDSSDKKITLIRFFPEPKLSYPIYSKKSALLNELEHFVFAIKSKTRPKTDLSHGLLVTKILEKIDRLS